MKPIRFTDFDEYANAIQHVDMDARLLHSRPRQHVWSLQDVNLESVRLQLAVEGSGILAQGRMRDDGWGMYVQLSGSPVSANGNPIGAGALAVLPPGAEFLFLGRGSVSWFSVFVPENLLIVDGESTSFASSVHVPQVQRQLFERLCSLLRNAVKNAADLEVASSQSRCVPHLHEELLSTVRRILTIGGTCSWEEARPGARHWLVSQALELIHDHQERKLSVPEIATTLTVSERTLLYAFREQLDVSPQEYLMNHRLHLARQCLKSCDPEELTVAAVATKLGFFDVGRFAGRYCKLFDEYPSVTLRHSRQRDP
jgi:AraC-like DNA-binding protein